MEKIWCTKHNSMQELMGRDREKGHNFALVPCIGSTCERCNALSQAQHPTANATEPLKRVLISSLGIISLDASENSRLVSLFNPLFCWDCTTIDGMDFFIGGNCVLMERQKNGRRVLSVKKD
jgi:hypothetical protein